MLGILKLRSGKVMLRIDGTGLYNSLRGGIVKPDDAFGTAQQITDQIRFVIFSPDCSSTCVVDENAYFKSTSSADMSNMNRLTVACPLEEEIIISLSPVVALEQADTGLS